MIAPDTELRSIARRLERLLAQRMYPQAQRCFAEYCHGLEETLRHMAPGDPRIRELEIDWRRLLVDSRQSVLIGRAHAAAQLAGLPCPGRFGDRAAPRPTWELFG